MYVSACRFCSHTKNAKISLLSASIPCYCSQVLIHMDAWIPIIQSFVNGSNKCTLNTKEICIHFDRTKTLSQHAHKNLPVLFYTNWNVSDGIYGENVPHWIMDCHIYGESWKETEKKTTTTATTTSEEETRKKTRNNAM